MYGRGSLRARVMAGTHGEVTVARRCTEIAEAKVNQQPKKNMASEAGQDFDMYASEYAARFAKPDREKMNSTEAAGITGSMTIALTAALKDEAIAKQV